MLGTTHLAPGPFPGSHWWDSEAERILWRNGPGHQQALFYGRVLGDKDNTATAVGITACGLLCAERCTWTPVDSLVDASQLPQKVGSSVNPHYR